MVVLSEQPDNQAAQGFVFIRQSGDFPLLKIAAACQPDMIKQFLERVFIF
jgi:hypothetical protein